MVRDHCYINIVNLRTLAVLHGLMNTVFVHAPLALQRALERRDRGDVSHHVTGRTGERDDTSVSGVRTTQPRVCA